MGRVRAGIDRGGECESFHSMIMCFKLKFGERGRAEAETVVAAGSARGRGSGR